MSVEKTKSSLTLQERVAARQQVRKDFVKEITLIQEAKDGILNMLENEPLTSRKGRDGSHQPSTMWRYSLSRYWCYNNWTNEFKATVRAGGETVDVMDMLFNNASFMGQVEAQIRKDINALGYHKVMFRKYTYTDRYTDQEVKDVKILVPVA